MAKVCIKSEKLTPFGEIFAIMEHFNGFFWGVLTEKSKAKKHILFICQNKNNIYFARCSYKASGEASILYDTKLS